MWIAFRLILALVGFVIRQLSRGSRGKAAGMFEGVEYVEKVSRHKGKVTGFKLGMPRRSPSWVRMHAEGRIDRFFKRIGVANEIQTGDDAFDDTVYVTCDHPYVAAILQETPALRDALRTLFEAGYHRVQFDGSMVFAERSSDEAPAPRDLQLLKRVYVASASLEDEMPSRFADPFLWKALVIEGVIWGIFGYAIGAVVEMALHKEDFHVDHSDVVKLGLLVAVLAFAVLVVLIGLIMRGSSRGHRVIVESALVLLLGLPASGLQIVGDTNRALDRAPPAQVARQIESCEVREHRGSKGRRWYSYHLRITQEPEQTGPRLPGEIEITKELCDAASPHDVAELVIGRGRWSIPWYRRITINGASWSAPL